MSKAILVLGMHRSGTSALAGAVARLGVELGDRLMEGTAGDNPEGFYEHVDVVAAHDAIARHRGRAWDDPRPAAADLDDSRSRSALDELVDEIITRDFAASPLWAVKDPRLCRFLPAWLELLDRRDVRGHCLLIARAPGEVAGSLARRDGFSAEKSAVLWVDHVLGALRDSAGRPRARLSYDDLLADPSATLTRCAGELGIEWPRSVEESADALRAFLRPELRHPPAGRPGGTGALGRLAEEIWSVLRVNTDWPSNDQLAAWRQALAEQTRGLPALALEHATQLAERESRRHAWEVEGRIRNEIAQQLTGTEARLAKDITGLAEQVAADSRELTNQAEMVSELAEEVAAHAQELAKQGELLSALRHQVHEIEHRVGDTEARVGAVEDRGILDLIRKALRAGDRE